jgi:hypothetical protein
VVEDSLCKRAGRFGFKCKNSPHLVVAAACSMGL